MWLRFNIEFGVCSLWAQDLELVNRVSGSRVSGSGFRIEGLGQGISTGTNIYIRHCEHLSFVVIPYTQNLVKL